MHPAPLRENENETFAALAALDVQATATDEAFDALVRVASLVCDVPVSLLSLVGQHDQWFKACVGLSGVTGTPREISFCAHAVTGTQVMEIPDALQDPRFADNPLVTDEPRIRFYAGAPIVLSGGEPVGALCVIDHRPRSLGPAQHAALAALAVSAARALEARVAMRRLGGVALDNARASTILRHSADAVIGMSVSGKIDRWNEAATRLLGYSAQSAIGMPVEALGADAVLGVEEINAWQRWGQPLTREGVRIHRDGSPLDVSLTIVPELCGNGTLRGLTEFVRDITAQKESERRLEQSLSQLSLIAESSPAMMAYWNADLTCRFANKAYQGRFGHGTKPIVGMSALEVLGEEGLARNRTFIEGALAGQPQRFERDYVLANGEQVHTLVTYTPDLADGHVCGYLAQLTDVTELKNSQIKLSQLALELLEAQRLGQIGSWEWVASTDTLVFSDELSSICGLRQPLRKVSDYDPCRHFPPQSLSRWCNAKADAVAQRKSLFLELEVRGFDDELRTLELRAEPVLDSSGAVLQLKGMAQDVTERKRAEKKLRRSQTFLARTGELAGVGGWELVLQTGEVLWSDEVCRIHGRPAGYKPSLDEAIAYYHIDSRPKIQAAVETALSGGPGFDLELQIVRCDGEPRWIRTMGFAEFEAGVAVRLVGAFQDITERHGLMLRLEEQHQLMRVTLQSIGDAVITTDADMRVTWLNPVAERMTGWRAEEAIGCFVDQVFHIVDARTRQSVDNQAALSLKATNIPVMERNPVLLSRDGMEYGVQDSASPIRGEQGEVLGAVLVFHDVTEQRRLSGEMSYRASHDALTGLVNRSEFELRLSRMVDEAQLNWRFHALMYIDLDQFKLVNDACGHTAGDLLLQQVARVLRDTTRATDVVARLGGDEFAILLEGCPINHAEKIAQKICNYMEEFRFLHDDRRFRIGTSIGLVPIDARWLGATAILQAADSCCYAAKEAGRNRVHVWHDTDATMQVRAGDMRWATRLEQALDDNRFVLYAQQIFQLAGESRSLSAEVLVRIREVDGSLVSPGVFLPAAERFHLATRIDRWVLRHTIDLLRNLHSLDRIGMICVNLSGQSVGDRAFHTTALGMLEAAGSEICRCVCIEITETAAITNLADATQFIEQARALGIRIALDDFGAGASSFGYLKSLRVSKIKVDGQFIRDVITDPLDDVAVRCFVDVARVVGARTVAEFVDSADVLARIKELGIDYAQGYHLHMPEPADRLITRFCAEAASRTSAVVGLH